MPALRSADRRGWLVASVAPSNRFCHILATPGVLLTRWPNVVPSIVDLWYGRETPAVDGWLFMQGDTE